MPDRRFVILIAAVIAAAAATLGVAALVAPAGLTGPTLGTVSLGALAAAAAVRLWSMRR